MQARQAGHGNVGEHGIVRLNLNIRERFFSGTRGIAFVLLGKKIQQDSADHIIVFNDQNGLHLPVIVEGFRALGERESKKTASGLKFSGSGGIGQAHDLLPGFEYSIERRFCRAPEFFETTGENGASQCVFGGHGAERWSIVRQ